MRQGYLLSLCTARNVSIMCGIVLFLGATFAFGLYTGAARTSLYEGIAQLLTAWHERSNLLGVRPIHWTQPTNRPSGGARIRSFGPPSRDLVLLQGFFDDGIEIRLIRRNGDVVRRWPISGSELVRGISHLRNVPTTDWNFDTHGVVALPDGSVVFNLDYVGLFKLDKCGNEVWRVPMSTHHSVEFNTDGTFWVSASRKYFGGDESPHSMFDPPFAEDVLIKVSAHGEILEEVSLIDVFLESNELGLMALAGGASPLWQGLRYDLEYEVFHLNDVEELQTDLASSFAMFEAGDLLVSLRNRNLIIVLDGKTRQVKWTHIGDWVRQHDPDWRAGGVISLFDNRTDGTLSGEILGNSRIIEIDPATREERIVYGGPNEFFHSTIRGKHQFLPNDHLLITDAQNGRVFEIDAYGEIVWEYRNSFGAGFAARISEARIYPLRYFRVKDWSCDG